MVIAKRVRVGIGRIAAQRGPTLAAARREVGAMADAMVEGMARAKVQAMAHGMAHETLAAATRPAWAIPPFARSETHWKTRNMP